jgi:hypothetical protein
MPALGLQDFAGANGVGGQGNGSANFRGWKSGGEFQGVGKKTVAEQHRDFIPPVFGQGGATPADRRLIHHVVVNQSGQMDHFNDHRQGDVIVLNATRGVTAQCHQHRPKLFALPAQGIFSIRDNFPVERTDLV